MKNENLNELDHEIHDEQKEILEHKIRVEKVQKLKAMGIDPWPDAKEVDSNSLQIIDGFKEEDSKKYTVAGRVMTIRLHGKTAFAHIQDSMGRLQVYFKLDNIGNDQFEFFKDFIDIGDIIWVTGATFKTKTGEVTLNVEQFKLLSKCLYPLPEKFHGLTDIEIKYRQRYLDLITNEDSRARFVKRSLIIRNIRSFLDASGYLEVETPMLHPIAGGAAARPFITHHNTLNTDFYLRIAPELYLKRLVVGGFDRVYEINRNFRNEGVSTKHNPEFTMVEFYTANKDYHYSMDFIEELLRKLAQEICGSPVIPYGQYNIDFGKPFERISVNNAVIKYGKMQDKDIEENAIDQTLKKHEVKLDKPNATRAEKIYALFDKIVEPQLIQPTFITDFPIEVSPLAKRDGSSDWAARCELFIAGMEICNSYSELNDPFEQAHRFQQQMKAYEEGDKEAHQFDEDFIKSLEYAMPPTTGVGIGIDRLVMLLTNTVSIKEVILFPALKKKV